MALMPTSSPSAVTKAPPELPRLIAASVCMKLSTPLAPMERALAETMPAVTVLLSPKGLPTAITHCPTFSLSESPMGRVGKFLPSILIRARSVVGSVPMILALNSRLSSRVTVNSSAPATTWLLVTIYPSGLIMTPEPKPSCLGVRTWRFCLPPLPCPGLPKKPNGSEKKSPNGSLFISTTFVFEFCTVLMLTTAASAFFEA